MPPRRWAAVIAVAVFVLDRVTKVLIERSVSAWESLHIIPGFFDIVHTKNRGAAFGMFADGSSELRTILLIGVSLAVLLFVALLLFRPARGVVATRLTLVGLSLVLGGALGNLYDRILNGMVTDFLEFYVGEYRFAAFNVADSAITTGAALLILDMWRSRRREPART
ncbi:MAG: signal peptidase II [Acidobacteria bacterium]|nr:signal peptidase II [Acidobacteriota bacterium]MBI3278821.1 signal peptidase II [Acidobacteriota bacterium]